ncbi:MAG TPA: SpoIIE family protein phosphatase, partial [Solirubrobacteraceae bacterium]|nr:SpoIIE family protein phosphatase [Solirubrobacteraceae bacterium]
VGRPGTLLGAFPAVSVHQEAFALRRDDLLVLYTDGVTEARTANGLFGVDRLASLFAQGAAGGAANAAAEIDRAVLAATGGRVCDDLAVLAVRATS